jgi:hypothetical protein
MTAMLSLGIVCDLIGRKGDYVNGNVWLSTESVELLGCHTLCKNLFTQTVKNCKEVGLLQKAAG